MLFKKIQKSVKIVAAVLLIESFFSFCINQNNITNTKGRRIPFDQRSNVMIENGHYTVLYNLVVVFSVYSVNAEHYCTINEQCVNFNFFFF